jgi:hypothetical protein
METFASVPKILEDGFEGPFWPMAFLGKQSGKFFQRDRDPGLPFEDGFHLKHDRVDGPWRTGW